jgi:predicted membrane protein
MARYGVVVLSILMMATTAVLAGSCGMQPGGTPQVGKMQRESKSVDPKNAQSARAQLKMGAGELTITGGADQLMEADISYNVSNWKPKVNYDVSGQEGELIVKQGSAEGANLSGEARNEWDISLNDELPTDLVVQMGAGESNLDVDSLTLTGVDLQMGAGKTTVDLTGDYAQDFEASIQGGVGEATVLLPSEVGVKAKAEGGLGKINAKGLKREGDSYVNDAYGESDVTLNVDVQGGVGEINLEVV